MKNKSFLAVLAALVLTVGFTTGADAARVRVSEPLGWLTPNSAIPGGAFAVSYAGRPLASEVLDTTGVFSLSLADVGFPGEKSTEANDSTLVGFIVAYSDSSADVANTLTAATATIEGSGDGNDWTAVQSSAAIAASDDNVVAFALYTRLPVDHQNLLTLAPMLRVRFATITGVMTACKLKLVYWKEDGR